VFNAANQIAGASYDNSGNQTVVNGNSVLYDAENRQIAVTEPPSLGGGTESYAYDGAGQRVEKNGPGGRTVFVYDALELLAAEYSTIANVLPCTTCYLTPDYLGTPRMVTDQNGNVVARHDYLPFGEEVGANRAGRSAQWGAQNDTIAQKFTEQERDAETGVDYFHARYYHSGMGRFTSPDPVNAGADILNPQSWNGYAYALNNPLNGTDPSGMDRIDCGGGQLADACVTDSAPPPIDTWAWWMDGGWRTLNGGGGGYSGGGGGGVGGGESQKPITNAGMTAQVPPPKNGNPPLAACDSAILNAINARFKTNFTDTNVTRRFQFSTGAPAGQGTLNLNIAVPVAMQPTKVAVGRYPVNPATYVLGAGATLHIPKGPGGADSSLTVPFSSSEFTAS
jgi:RHS repeat-associated protein